MNKNSIPREKSHRSLHYSIIITNIALLILISVLYFISYHFITSYKAKREIQSLANEITGHLTDVLKFPLYSFDDSLISAICDVSMHLEIIEKITLYGEEGEILYQNCVAERVSRDYVIDRTIMYDNRPIGRLEIAFTYQKALKEEASYLTGIAQAVVIYVLLMVLILRFIIRRYIDKPLVTFIESIEGITEGRYSTNVDTDRFRHKELYIIGQKFNNMISQINKRDKELKSQADIIMENNLRLKSLMDTIPDGILLIDSSHKIIKLNKTLLDMLSITEEGALSYDDSMSIKMKDIFAENIPQIYLSGTKTSLKAPGIETRLCNNTPVMLRITNISLNSQTFYLLVITDISEIKRYEEDIYEQKNRLSVTLDSIGEGIIATDSEGIIRLINPVGCDLTGFLEEDAVGRKLEDIFILYDEVSGQRLTNLAAKTITLNEIGSIKSPRILIAKDGTSRIVNGSVAPIKDRSGNIIGSILVFRDITELKRIEEENLQADKLKSLGVLAGGIGHDFSNILTVILANLSLLKMKTESQRQASIEHLFDIIENACERSGALTKELLSFSRAGELLKKQENLELLIRQTVKLAVSGTDTEVNIASASAIPALNIDAGQMSRVFHNIFINALSAMPNKKRIDISLGTHTSTAQGSRLIKPGDYVKISIRDYGTGIDKEAIKMIFDPYYSTKSKGSGLGLAIAYSVIKKHEGYIFVDSEVSKGTEFIIYIPL